MQERNIQLHKVLNIIPSYTDLTNILTKKCFLNTLKLYHGVSVMYLTILVMHLNDGKSYFFDVADKHAPIKERRVIPPKQPTG